MFVHMSIHDARPEHVDVLTASMHRFGAAAHGSPGFLGGHVLRDRGTGRLVGMTLWRNEDDWRAALPAQREAVEDDPFDVWELRDAEIFHLDEM